MNESLMKLGEAFAEERLRISTHKRPEEIRDCGICGPVLESTDAAFTAVGREMDELRKDADRWRYFHRRFYMDRHSDTMLDESGRLSVSIPVIALRGCERCLSPSDVDIVVDNAIESEKAAAPNAEPAASHAGQPTTEE
ncbi:MAG TPA: hypothetical protein VFW04_15660 [Gemmatimonadaceae bacterium]|nr:hypothetical protein [Gemmatimonadaceae bacterium]